MDGQDHLGMEAGLEWDQDGHKLLGGQSAHQVGYQVPDPPAIKIRVAQLIGLGIHLGVDHPPEMAQSQLRSSPPDKGQANGACATAYIQHSVSSSSGIPSWMTV